MSILHFTFFSLSFMSLLYLIIYYIVPLVVFCYDGWILCLPSDVLLGDMIISVSNYHTLLTKYNVIIYKRHRKQATNPHRSRFVFVQNNEQNKYVFHIIQCCWYFFRVFFFGVYLYIGI